MWQTATEARPGRSGVSGSDVMYAEQYFQKGT